MVGKYELKSGVFTDMKSLQALKEVGGDFTFSSMSVSPRLMAFLI